MSFTLPFDNILELMGWLFGSIAAGGIAAFVCATLAVWFMDAGLGERFAAAMVPAALLSTVVTAIALWRIA